MISFSARFTRFFAVGTFLLVFAGWYGTAPADTACKPAAPAKASKCNKDAQCCPGLLCEAGACQGGCRIDGTFYASDAPNGPCQFCQPSQSTTTWTDRAPGTGCTDGNACTTSDGCQAGVCNGTTVSCPVTNPDQAHCWIRVCAPSSGVCSSTFIGFGDPSCQESECVTHGDCDDSNACTVDQCFGPAGQETCSWTPTSCDDGNPCTIDSCDPVLSCVNTPSDPACGS